MLIMETIAKIRRLYKVQGQSIRQITKQFSLSRNTVRKILRKDITKMEYKRTIQPKPKLKGFTEYLEKELEADKNLPKKRRRTAKKFFEEIEGKGYLGSYDSVRRYIKKWKVDNTELSNKVYVPLSFEPGEAFQFDWSDEEIVLKGEPTKVKVANIKLCYSRLSLSIVYPNEQQEMVLDAHNKAFAWFNGCCKKGIYDNMKTAVSKILIGKNRIFNQRFLQLCSHYLFEPIACNPRSGWEKGQIEKQVNTVRQNFFVPLLKVNSLEELNQELSEKCKQWAKKHFHPEQKDKTIWDVFEQEEKQLLIKHECAFDSYKIDFVRSTSTSLVQYDTNRYSIDCRYAGQVVELRIYADRIVITKDEKIIGEHKRSFERHQTIYNPLHYILVLSKKPGALRNGTPFKNWKLPNSLMKVKQILEDKPDGNKQFIKILSAILTYGLDEVDNACKKTLEKNIYSSNVILNSLNNKNNILVSISNKLQLNQEIKPDCKKYNKLIIPLEIYNKNVNSDTNSEVCHV